MTWDLLVALLPVLAGLVVVASILAYARRWTARRNETSDVWQKYPGYLLLAAAFMASLLAPPGWHALALLLCLLGFLCSRELCGGLGLRAAEGVAFAAVSAGLIAAADFLQPSTWQKVWLFTAIASVMIVSLARPREVLGRRLAAAGACLGLFPWCLASILWLRGSAGDFHVLFLYIVVASNDAFAQIIGQLLGTHQFARALSPGKTLEGLAGGLILAVLAGVSLCVAVGRPASQGALMAATLSIAGVLGDLSVSGWKRYLGLKDFGNFLGPHGGALDRFDSLLFAAPVFFLLWGG